MTTLKFSGLKVTMNTKILIMKQEFGLTYTMSGDKLVSCQKKSLILQLILFPKVSLMALNVKEKNIYITI